MQSSRCIREANHAGHTSRCRRQPDYVNQVFANWVSQIKYSQIRETKNRAYGLPREDHYTPEYVPNGVRWKNLLRRHLPSSAVCRKLVLNFVSGLSSLLELAKGFEPLTL
jgi:hypothetical protein